MFAFRHKIVKSDPNTLQLFLNRKFAPSFKNAKFPSFSKNFATVLPSAASIIKVFTSRICKTIYVADRVSGDGLGGSGLVGKYRWRELPVVITGNYRPGKYSQFWAKWEILGGGEYEILELFWLKYSVKFLYIKVESTYFLSFMYTS